MAGKLFAKHVVRKLFLEDWGLKLLALVITLALWFGVTGLSSPFKTRMTIPLNLSVPSNAEITNTPVSVVSIEIRGDKKIIQQIVKSDLVATVDLSDVPPGDRVISLTPGKVFVDLPKGVTLEDVEPSGILVKLEAVEEKDIEVKVQTVGEPAAGYEVYSSVSLPSKIRVRGPASVIKTLESIQTDMIDISGKREEFTARQVPVGAPNPKAAVFNTVVDIYFRIGEKRGERPFMAPVSGEPGKNASFVIYGPRTLLQKTRADQLKVEIYLNDNGEEAPRVVLPAELQDFVEVRKLKVK